MNFLGTALQELWGLFVEDGSFTIGIIICVAVASFLLPHSPIPSQWRGVAFFVILALVLIENVRRSASK